MNTEKPDGVLRILFGNRSKFVKDIAPLFLITIFLFLVSSFMGYTLGDRIPSSIFDDILSNFPDLTDPNFVNLVITIASNNIIASGLFVISGFLFGIPPLLFIIFNGFVIGWVSYSVASTHGISFVLMTILPHGIIEIPTITLSAAIGLGLGYKVIHKLRKRDGIQIYFQNAVTIFITRIIPFLIFAAVVETFLILSLV